MKRPAPTFEISINFWSDPKVLAAGYKAAVLYIRCGCESRRHMTDGVVLLSQIRALAVDLGDGDKLAKCLVENDLWSPCKGGYRIPLRRWREWQFTSAQIESVRAFERDKKRRQRKKPRQEPAENVPPGQAGGQPGGPLSTSQSTSQSTSASAKPSQPEALSDAAPTPPDAAHTRGAPNTGRRGRASPWSWLAGWEPGPDDTTRSVLMRLGVEEPALSPLIRSNAQPTRIVDVARDVQASPGVVKPVAVLVAKLLAEFVPDRPAKSGPLSSEITGTLGRIAQMREQRVSASVAGAASRRAPASPPQASGP